MTFSAVIPARVMQPEVSTRGKQNWRIALSCYGMAFALRHRVHLAVGQPLQSLAPPLCAPARVIPGRTLLEGEGRVGSRASPQLQITPNGQWWWAFEVPVAVPLPSETFPAFRSRDTRAADQRLTSRCDAHCLAVATRPCPRSRPRTGSDRPASLPGRAAGFRHRCGASRSRPAGRPHLSLGPWGGGRPRASDPRPADTRSACVSAVMRI